MLPPNERSTRYHGLDALRGIAMLLGIVLHAALPYVPNIQAFWPADGRSSEVINAVFQFVHIWRMPLFFILAGFFANLVISRKSWLRWWRNRFLRIGLPMVLFFPLMSLTLPWIFAYGWVGQFKFFYSDEGQPFHLWFLWHLMIFVTLTAVCRFPYLVGTRAVSGLTIVGLGFIGTILYRSKSMVSGIVFRSRYPVVFIVLCCFISGPTWGELIVNPIASGFYFTLGYSLFGNHVLFAWLKMQWRYYFLAGAVGFVIYIVLYLIESKNLVTGIYESDYDLGKNVSDLFALFQYVLRIACSVVFSYAFIGLAEKRFGSYNSQLRFISDGAYWMYLIHLPVVTLITFFMFNIRIPIEIKFLGAIMMTSIICLVSYKYLVRWTPIGMLLNGKRYPFKVGS